MSNQKEKNPNSVTVLSGKFLVVWGTKATECMSFDKAACFNLMS